MGFAFVALLADPDYHDLLVHGAKVLGNWTGFSTKLYSSLFAGNVQHSLVSALWNTFAIAMIVATVSTLLGSVAAIGIFNLKARARNA